MARRRAARPLFLLFPALRWIGKRVSERGFTLRPVKAGGRAAAVVVTVVVGASGGD